MIFRNPSPARPVCWALAAMASTAMLAASATAAQAQPKHAPPPKSQQRVAPAHAAAAPQQQSLQPPQLIYSPWTKFCIPGKQADAKGVTAKELKGKNVCLVGTDGRVESGMPVVAAVLIEPQATPRKVLRVTVPYGMALARGTRIIVDNHAPLQAPYVVCIANGCMSDYEATSKLIADLKKGHTLYVQAINMQQQPITLSLPLDKFAKAYDGPPMDPNVFKEQQKKLQEELQRRADETRKKLESEPPSPAPAKK